MVAENVEAAFGGQFLPAFGDERHLIRPDGTRDLDDFVHGGHFEIQPLRYGLAENVQVAVLNVPAVLAKMDRDAVGAARRWPTRQPQLDRALWPCEPVEP